MSTKARTIPGDRVGPLYNVINAKDNGGDSKNEIEEVGKEDWGPKKKRKLKKETALALLNHPKPLMNLCKP